MTSFKAPERIETARLVLRRPVEDDAEAIFARYAGDREVTRFLSWPTHRSLADTRRFLGWSDHEWQRWPAGPYVMVSRVDGTVIGGTGLAFETPSRAATGYVLARDAWGRGLATESLAAMVDLARVVGVERLYAICFVEHRASARVLEKCGFTCEGVLRRHTEFPNLLPGEPSDVLSYAMALRSA